MANLESLTVNVELKKGIFYKLIDFKVFIYLIAILVNKFNMPFRWYQYIAVKSLKYRIGNGRWHSFSLSKIK